MLPPARSWHAFLLLAGLALAGAVAALRLEPDRPFLELGGRLEHLVDADGRFDLEAVAAGRAGLFRPGEGRIAFANTRAVHWFRLNLERPPEAGADWLLEFGLPTLADVRLYRPTPGGYRILRAGAGTPRSQRELPLAGNVFPLRLPAGTSRVYLRAHDAAELVVPVRLWQREAYQARHGRELAATGLLLGAMLGLLAYNGFLYLALADRSYGLYLLSGSGLVAACLMATGWGPAWLWPESPGFALRARVLLPALWGVAYWLFLRAFFELAGSHPRLYRLCGWLSALFAACALWSLTGERYVAARVLNAVAMLGIPAVFWIGIRRWREGYTPARYLLLGQAVLLLPTSLMVLRVAGLVPAGWALERALLWGGTGGLLLFAMALADRSRRVQRAAEEGRAQALAEKAARVQLLESHERHLEEEVRARTAQLELAYRRLQDSQLRLGQDAWHDGLTGLPNRRLLTQRYEQVRALAARNGERFGLMVVDLDGFRSVNERWGKDAADAVLRAVAVRLLESVRVGDTVARFGGDEFLVLMTSQAEEADAEQLAVRLLAALRAPVAVGEAELPCSACIGIALNAPQQDELLTLLRLAEEVLAEAKRVGHGSYKLYRPLMG